MKVSQLKEQIRGIIRERSVKAIQKDYSNVVSDMEKHLDLYKKSKGTPDEKKHIGHLKDLTAKKKKLQAELDLAVANLYKNAELKVEESVNERKYYVTYNRGRGQGKGLEKVFDKKAFKSTDKPMVFNSYKDAKEYAEKMEKMFRNSIGGGTAYWVSDEKMNRVEESVNEVIEPQTKKIASLTGTRPDAVKHFVSKHALNITKLLKFIEKGKLSDRMDFTTALAGKDGNPIQKRMIKMFQESVIREDIKKDIDKFIDKLNKQFPDQEYTISSGGGKYVRINHKNRKFGGGESAWGFISLVDNPTKGFKKGDLLKAAGYNTPAKHARGNILNGDAKYDKYSPTYLKEEINESTEPQVISQLRDIVKKKQYQDVKDPSSGKKMKVDMQTANIVLKIYDGLSNANKQTMVKMGLPKMIDVSNKIISKYR
jgi:hypothetical protein